MMILSNEEGANISDQRVLKTRGELTFASGSSRSHSSTSSCIRSIFVEGTTTPREGDGANVGEGTVSEKLERREEAD